MVAWVKAMSETSNDKLTISAKLRFAAMENPRPGMAEWVSACVSGMEHPRDSQKPRFPGQVVSHPYPVFGSDTSDQVRRAFGDWPHLVLETAPKSLVPVALELVKRHPNDSRIPRVLVVPAETNLRKYADEREKLAAPGVVVVRMGSAELRGILKNCAG